MAMRAFAAGVLVTASLVFAATAGAGVVSQRTSTEPGYWTADRLLRARPMRLGEVRSVELESIRGETAPSGFEAQRGGGMPSSPPRTGVAPRFENYLFDPKLLAGAKYRAAKYRAANYRAMAGRSSADRLPVEPANRGTFQLDFSSSRLVPEVARIVWPFSSVGKLFLSGGGSDFICSAAVVSSRVVVTAGHCVFDAAAGEFYTNFMFVPAYHRGEAPFGEWSPNFMATTDTWANGEDEIPSDADFGVLVMEDQGGMKIGNVTGWLGYKLNDLTPNHVKLLGYPKNFDGGQRMHQVDSGAFECCFGRNAVYGSDMQGGSSGGPWVQNFGVRSKGQKGGSNKQTNRIVGITSFGPINRAEKFQGSSIPGAEFQALFNEACDDAAGNCTKKGKPKAR